MGHSGGSLMTDSKGGGRFHAMWVMSSKHGLAGRLSLIPEWWEAGEGIPVKECVTEGVEENGHF